MSKFPAEGHCDCKAVRYRMLVEPMFVHCCHCRWCQRETGSAFVLNAIIEASKLEVLGEPEWIHTPSHSGRGQNIARCPTCKIATWSTYSMPTVRFVRVGTLVDPDIAPPNVHIFTSTKVPWLTLPPEVPAFDEYYDIDKHWPRSSLARRALAYAKS